MGSSGCLLPRRRHWQRRSASVRALRLTTFFIGLAVLSLLSDKPRKARFSAWSTMQWLDGVSAQALAFVARPLVDRWNPAWIDTPRRSW
jgi:hypothetical protein